MLAPRRVYATLLNTEDWEQCCFEITAAKGFEELKANYQIPFSMDYRKPGKTAISPNQLNQIISEIWQKKFQFGDKFILNAQFSVQDLPPEINGDDFYTHNEVVHQVLKKGEQFDLYELRYINNSIGFGLFARREIKKDTCILVYLGKKMILPDGGGYYFFNTVDSLNMGINSEEYGNSSRFINHAKAQHTMTFCEANLNCIITNAFGHEMVSFWALRTIQEGEQLLFDYGHRYFVEGGVLRFKTNGKLIDVKGKLLRDTHSQRLAMLRLFAKSGINDAKYRLIKRYGILILLIGFIYKGFHLL
jgi:hypothetical protein